MATLETSPSGQNAGDLTLNAQRLTLTDGAAIATATFGEGNAGDLTLSVRQLSVGNGSAIVTATFGKGDGGTLTIKDSKLIEVIGTSPDGSFSSGIRADSVGAGKAGTLNIETGQLIVGQGGEVNVSAQGTSNAGEVNINARSIFLDRGTIRATSTSGGGGDINLRVSDIALLRNGSQISTRAGNQPSDRGNGGNMNINAQFVVAVPKENSDIIANAFAGRGGNINITAQGIFGLQLNNTKQPIPVSEITASSQLGIDGTITINSPDVDPSRGLTELPSNFTDSSNQIAAGCPADKGNRFSVTGRGGIRIIPVNICADAPFGKIRAIYPKPNSYPNPPPRHNQVKVTYKR
ncbi:S-layer family protein [Allocoleopsis sp.]|uniref:S-layer family protein n=1 Tax=Allocoleopsis sp. TaxID=3088169 RepID=UPI002FD1213D